MSIGFFENKTRDQSNGSLFTVDKVGDQPIALTGLFLKAIMKFAACSCTSYSNDEEWVKPFNFRLVKPFAEQILFPGSINSHDYCFFSEQLGLKVSVFESNNEVIVAFGAHNSGATELPQDIAYLVAEKQTETIKANLKGESPSLYKEAQRVVIALLGRPNFRGKKFIVCGQSFGGSIAEYVGLSLRIETYCFNSIMLGSGLIESIPVENIREAHSFIHIISVENDFASDLIDSKPGYQWVAKQFNLPRHFGNKFVLPSAYPSIMDRHIYMMGSLMQHLGYPTRTKTSELSGCDLLPEVFLYERLESKMVKMARVVFLLNEVLQCFDNDKLKEIFQTIKDFNPELYSFLCFSVWFSLGKKDCGDCEWGEKRLLENPQLIHMITDGNENNFLLKIINYYEFLNRIFELIPDPSKELISKKPSLVAAELTKNVRNKMGLNHFQVSEKDVFLFISKLYIFMADQLKNGLGVEMRRIEAIVSKNVYQLLPKENLLANRFMAIQAVSKRILIASVEYLGVLKVGGLAEAVREMSVGLKNQGHEVTLIMPRYERFPQDPTISGSLQEDAMTIDHYFNGERKDPLFHGKVGDIDALFVGNKKLKKEEPDLFELGSTGIYKIAGDDSHATRLKERFAYFGSALAAFIYQMRNHFDVVVFNDWHGALAIHLAVKRYFDAWMKGAIPALVYVFHNNGYAAQGVLDQNSKPLFDKLELNTNYVNVTQQSLRFADHCCTVSPSYAEEVQGREGNGLADQMRKIAIKGNLTGILNGANPKAFNPETDLALMNWKDPETGELCPLNYGLEDDISYKKGEIKMQLQKWLKTYHPHYIEEFGVDVTRDNILLFVGRFDSSQKGLEKFKQAMYAAKEQGATLIVMGSYSTEDDVLARKILLDLQEQAADLKGPDWGGALILIDKVNSKGKYDLQQCSEEGVPGIGSLCRAIATFGFFPSKYEPCGLVQYETWLFGGLVVASGVGGFADTIYSNTKDDSFNGFTFKRHDDWDSLEQDDEIKETVAGALNYWKELDGFERQELMSLVMNSARLSGWTSDVSPQGISPISQYERVLEKASLASKQRAKFEPIPVQLQSYPLGLN